MNIQEAIDNAVNEHLQISKEIQKLINLCNTDLYFGPLEAGEDEEGVYPGFSKALNIITDELDEISDLWYDNMTGEIYDSETQAESAMCYEDEEGEIIYDECHEVYHVERRDVLTTLLGKELASYI